MPSLWFLHWFLAGDFTEIKPEKEAFGMGIFPSSKRREPVRQPRAELVSGSTYNIQQEPDGTIVIVGRAKTVKDLERLLRDLNEAIGEILGKGKARKK